VAHGSATASAGKWTISTLSNPLPSGNNKFSAYATEVSGLGNGEGESSKVEFEVDTLPPSVAITKGPEARSNKTTPSFSGTASENTEVTVHIKLGESEVASGSTTASAGKWSISKMTKLQPTDNNK